MPPGRRFATSNTMITDLKTVRPFLASRNSKSGILVLTIFDPVEKCYFTAAFQPGNERHGLACIFSESAPQAEIIHQTVLNSVSEGSDRDFWSTAPIRSPLRKAS